MSRTCLVYETQKSNVYEGGSAYPKDHSARKSKIGYGCLSQKCKTTEAVGHETPLRDLSTPILTFSC
jgi:hypothetical protein